MVFYREPSGEAPVLDWLTKLRKYEPERLRNLRGSRRKAGHAWPRAAAALADLLRDGIYELRIRKGRVNYRILYFFHGRELAVLGTRSRKRTWCPTSKLNGACAASERTNPIPSGTVIRTSGGSFMAQTKHALKILEKLTGRSATLRRGIANARLNLEVAQMIYDARTTAGLSQRQLAEMLGTRQSVIARLEDADYRGHSLSMLQRVENALGQRLQLRFVTVPRRGPKQARETAVRRNALRRA